MPDPEIITTGYDRLVHLVAPPAAPVGAHRDRTAVEATFGTRLPLDCKRLVEAYGWGEFCDFLRLRTPSGTSEHNGITWQSTQLWGFPDRARARYPCPLHPAPGAPLIRGATADGDRLCWVTDAHHAGRGLPPRLLPP